MWTCHHLLTVRRNIDYGNDFTCYGVKPIRTGATASCVSPPVDDAAFRSDITTYCQPHLEGIRMHQPHISKISTCLAILVMALLNFDSATDLTAWLDAQSAHPTHTISDHSVDVRSEAGSVDNGSTSVMNLTRFHGNLMVDYTKQEDIHRITQTDRVFG